jgi:hypothetical protein
LPAGRRGEREREERGETGSERVRDRGTVESKKARLSGVSNQTTQRTTRRRKVKERGGEEQYHEAEKRGQ